MLLKELDEVPVEKGSLASPFQTAATVTWSPDTTEEADRLIGICSLANNKITLDWNKIELALKAKVYQSTSGSRGDQTSVNQA